MSQKNMNHFVQTNKPYELIRELMKTRLKQDPYMRDYYALKKVREAKWAPLQQQTLQSGKEVNEVIP